MKIEDLEHILKQIIMEMNQVNCKSFRFDDKNIVVQNKFKNNRNLYFCILNLYDFESPRCCSCYQFTFHQ